MGRTLAIDFGLNRVGVAISDRTGTFASPLETYERRNEHLDARHFRDLVRQEGVERIVVGLPVHTSGRESELSRRARQWGVWLEQVCGVPVVFFDERYSTAEAEALLLQAGLTKDRRKARRDMLAAHILLQAYLEAGSPATPADPGSLDDTEAPPP